MHSDSSEEPGADEFKAVLWSEEEKRFLTAGGASTLVFGLCFDVQGPRGLLGPRGSAGPSGQSVSTTSFHQDDNNVLVLGQIAYLTLMSLGSSWH